MRSTILFLLILLSLAIPGAAQAERALQSGPFQVNLTILSVDPSPSYVDQVVVFRVRAAAVEPLGGIPTGTVEVKSSLDVICTILLDASGEGDCLLVFKTPGKFTLKAVYPGATGYLPAASSDYSHTVNPRHVPTVTFTSVTPFPSIINSFITVQVTVSSTGPTPTGSLMIFRGDAACSMPAQSFTNRCNTVLAGGSGSCSLPLTVSGSVKLCAVYSGDFATLPGTGRIDHWVSAGNTALGIQRVEPSPSVLGQSAWVYFTLTSLIGDPPTSTLVTVTSGASHCSATLAAGRCLLTFLQPHLQPVVATYPGATAGETVFDPSTSNTWVQRVNAPPTNLLLSANQLEAMMPVGETAGTFSVTDPNPDETHVYSLVTGAGSFANAYFEIVSNRLLLRSDLPQDGGNLSIRVRATDPAGLFIEREFIISVGKGELPDTGFAPAAVTRLSVQPADKAYRAYGSLEVEIPRLGVSTEILGVPWTSDGWDATWLGDALGWLDGTAFPTWQGNSVLVGHNYLADGTEGPFADLSSLRWGDRVLVHAYGVTSIYEIRSVTIAKAGDASPLRHEDKAWLTLITCRNYDEKLQSYQNRVIARAVLIEVRAMPAN